MSFTIVAALIAFLLVPYVDARRRTAQHLQYIAEKKQYRHGLGYDGQCGVLYPDVPTTVCMGFRNIPEPAMAGCCAKKKYQSQQNQPCQHRAA